MKTRQRIGLFGGMFDPPHIGHLLIAGRAVEQLGLRMLYFIPASVSPFKQGRLHASADNRKAMLELAIDGNERFAVSDFELARGAVSYTIDTVRHFRTLYPDDKLYLLIGGDHPAAFHKWKNAGEILQNVTLAVYPRDGRHMESLSVTPPKKPAILKGAEVAVSSTEIRTLVANGRPIRYMVPDAVERYIREHRLYRKHTTE